jgi:Fe-S-cluster containining protein
LGRRDDPGRASAAARLVHGLNEVSTRKSPGTAKLACAKGCGACCYNWVGAMVPEVLLLAATVRNSARSQPGLIGRIVERTEVTAGRGRAERFGAKLPCPLLADNQCSFYRERPAVCRQTTSLDLAGCLDEFEGRGYGGEIKVSSVYLAHARNSRVPLSAALRLTGLDTATYELSAALARALAHDETERRWLGGEDVMAGIERGPRDQAADDAIGAIERELAPVMRDAGVAD